MPRKSVFTGRNPFTGRPYFKLVPRLKGKGSAESQSSSQGSPERSGNFTTFAERSAQGEDEARDRLEKAGEELTSKLAENKKAKTFLTESK